MNSPVVVIDNGACRCRVGVAGEEQPRAAFQNAVAKAKGDTRLLLGSEIDETRSVNQLNVKRPFDRGYLINWSLESGIWGRMLEQSLPEVPLNCASLLMTEPLFNLPSIQSNTLQVVFEQFGVHSFYAAPAAELALHKWAADHADDAVAQSLSGIVLDAGFSFTHAVPIFDGRVQRAAVRRIRLGGKHLTNLLKEWVSYRSINLKDEPYLVELMKEATCFVAPDVAAAMATCFPAPRSQVSLEFVLPDGVENVRGVVCDPRDPRVMAEKQSAMEAAAAGGAAAVAAARAKQAATTVLLNNERFMVPEALFTPSDINIDQAGVCETIANSVCAAHPVFRPLLTRNVLLIGGTSACPGFKERVVHDLRPLLDEHYDVAVNQGAQPAEMAWQGGSVLGASDAFAALAISRAMYEEEGMARTLLRMGA